MATTKRCDYDIYKNNLYCITHKRQKQHALKMTLKLASVKVRLFVSAGEATRTTIKATGTTTRTASGAGHNREYSTIVTSSLSTRIRGIGSQLAATA